MPDEVSLRRRLTWYVVLTLLVMTAVSGIAIYQGTTQEADEIFSASLVQTARILDGLISRDAIDANREQLMRALESAPEAHKYERKLFFVVVDADGKLLLHSRQAPGIPDKVVDSGFSEFRFEGKKWFTFTLNSSRENLRIIVGERSEIREEITEYIGGGLLVPLLLLTPLVLWLLWQIIGVALKPLQDVTDQLKQQDLKDLNTINVADVPREISPLVNALNQMIEDLDAAYARERRFVSDASHELRNPLAALLINVENAIEESQGRESLETMESMKTSIQRLAHMVSQLLELSHFENPSSDQEFAQVDLGRICERVIDAMKTQADEKGLQIELQLPQEKCLIMGAESLLTSLVSNLVDNAVNYCDANCRIRVRCERKDNCIQLSVDDSGPGLKADEREKAMGRFYRAADTNTRGAGLGLSIVKSIAENHHATVELDQSDLGGLAARVRFDLS